jgi:Rrf2 family protein
MRISAKGRYALSALIEVARQTYSGEPVSVNSISEKLGISKIFLEQTVAQLKKSEILSSTKGKGGGYRLTREAGKISIRDVLFAVENTLFEKTELTGMERAPANAAAMEQLIFNRLDKAVDDCLLRITVQDLLDFSVQQNADQAFMLNM